MFVRHEDHQVVAGVHGLLEVMGDHQDAAAEVAADPFDQLIHDVRAGHIDALRRLVEDQQVGPVNQRPRHQQPLELAARQGRDRRVAEPFETHSGEGGVDLVSGETAGQRHQAAQGQRQRRAHRQSLRDIAHLQRRRPRHVALGDVDQPEDGLRAGGLAGAVGADQEDQLAASHLQVHVPDDPAFAAPHPDVTSVDEQAGTSRLCVFQGHQFETSGGCG